MLLLFVLLTSLSCCPAFTPQISRYYDFRLASTPTIVTVPLPNERSYPITIAPELLQTHPSLIYDNIEGNTALMITTNVIANYQLINFFDSISDGNVDLPAEYKRTDFPPEIALLPPTVLTTPDKKRLSIHTIILPDGEATKSMSTITSILSNALSLRLSRKTTLIAFGGGVVGDITGFAASIFLRGCNFVQVPTTLMSCVDSSVGGKTGVNSEEYGKNLIGSFWQPKAVVVDLNVMGTLPDREYWSGLSEVVKYGLIGDADFFRWQEANTASLVSRNPPILAEAVKRCCENKANVVAADEREGGARAKLNLGHTYGHAIENGEGYGTWLHGEAVSIGTMMALVHSYKEGWIGRDIVERVCKMFVEMNLPISLPEKTQMTPEIFKTNMQSDKKVSDGVLSLILLKGELGSAIVTNEYSESIKEETIKLFCEYRGNDFSLNKML